MTERKQQRRAADRRSSDRAMAVALSTITQGVVVTDDDGRSLVINERAREILGPSCPENRMFDVPPAGSFLPDGVTEFPPARWPVRRALRGERVAQELLLLSPTSSPHRRWICASSWPTNGSADGPGGGSVLVLNETSEPPAHFAGRIAPEEPAGFPPSDVGFRGCDACMRHVRALRQSYGLLSRAVRQTADTVVITDSRGLIEFVNPAFETTTGYTADEAIGKTPRILKSGLHDAEFYAGMWSNLRSGAPFVGEIVNRTKSGRLYKAQQTITPLKDDTGEVTHFVSVLKDVTELRQAQEREIYMALAQEVQQRYYRRPASPPGFEIAAVAQPAHLTGGDYFDVLRQDDGRLCLVIGDVVGHGFGAALVMAELRAYVRAFVRQGASPAEILTRTNNILVADLAANQFVTLLVARIDLSSGAVEYASAGHTSGHILRTDPGLDSELGSTGPPLGFFSERAFEDHSILPLAHGETLLLVTDGIFETRSPGDEEFGTDRLLHFVRQNLAAAPDDLVELIAGEIRRFSDGGEQLDDITTLVCRRL